MVALEKAPDLSEALGPKANRFLERAVLAIVDRLPVEEVWLFGSTARGTANAQSDLDLLVVLENEHGRRSPTTECFELILNLGEPFAVDVVAIPRSKWEFEKANPFGVFGDIHSEGIQLYAK